MVLLSTLNVHKINRGFRLALVRLIGALFSWTGSAFKV